LNILEIIPKFILVDFTSKESFKCSVLSTAKEVFSCIRIKDVNSINRKFINIWKVVHSKLTSNTLLISLDVLCFFHNISTPLTKDNSTLGSTSLFLYKIKRRTTNNEIVPPKQKMNKTCCIYNVLSLIDSIP